MSKINQTSHHQSLRQIVLIGCLNAAFTFTQAYADAWNTVGGNAARNGQSLENGPNAAQILWQHDTSLGDQHTIIAEQPLILDDVVVTFLWPSFSEPDQTYIAAYDLNTGDEIWTRQLPVDPGFPGWRNRLLGVRDGQIYASRSGEGAPRPDFVYALDPADGHTIWVSPERIHQGGTESLSFAPNGDLITITYTAADGHQLARMDKNNGNVLWETPYIGVASGSSIPACTDSTVYMYTNGINNTKISAFDITTGAFKYSTPYVPGNTQQSGPMIGHDGTIYMNRHDAFMIAFEDTGTALVELWRTAMDGVPFETNAVGFDGSVYCLAPDGRYQRLKPTDGSVMDTTVDPIPDFGTNLRPVVDATGRIYIHNGASGSSSRLFCFSPELNLLWEMSGVSSHRGGPALGANGTLVVTSSGQYPMTAFRTAAPCPADLTGDDQVNIDDIFAALGLWGACPDPCPPYCTGDLTDDCMVNIDDIFAILGQWGPCE